VVAGGRVIVASSDGVIRLFDPVSGALARQVALPGGAASNPVVAGGVLHVVAADGTLRAFR
jgi:outer membrane protein assembly factor BamB